MRSLTAIPQQLIRRQRHVLSALVGVTIALASPLAAGDSNFKLLDCVLDRDTWDVITAELSIDDDEQARVHDMLEAYWTSIEELDASTYEAFLDAGWREITQLSEKRNRTYHPARTNDDEEAAALTLEEQKNRLIEAHHESMEQERLKGLRQSDAMLEAVIAQVGHELQWDGESIVRVHRIVRRENLLTKETQRRRKYHDLNGPLDIFQVMAQAREDEGEIAQLETVLESLENEDDDDLPSLEEILEIYELQIDAMHVETLAEARRPPDPDFKAVISELEEQSDIFSGYAKAWSKRHAAFDAASQLINQLLTKHVGEQANRQWQQRIERYLCPELTSPTWMDGVVDWIAKQPGATPEQIDAVKLVHKAYVMEKQPLISRAVAAGISARRRHWVTDGTEGAQLSFARAKLALHDLSIRSISQVKLVLTPEQYKAAKMQIERSLPRAIGPYIGTDALERLRAYEQYHEPLGPVETSFVVYPEQ